MSKRPSAAKFKKRRVTMKKAIPVFQGYVATGEIGKFQFSIVSPDRETCNVIWDRLGMSAELDHRDVPEIVLCRASDVDRDVKPDTQR